MSGSRLFRILYYLLEKGHATAPELAARFEVSARTIYRDVESLSGAGIPVYAEAGRNGGIRLLHSCVLDRTVFCDDEKRELLAVIQSMSATGSDLGKETLAKLSALFRIDTGNWLSVDFSRWGRQSCDREKFELLKTAVIRRQEAAIIYESAAGGRGERTIRPLQLCYKARGWYLKAFCLARQDFRIFKLNRILDMELLPATFSPMRYPEADDTDWQAYPQIVLLFAKETAYRVYDEFDESQIKRRKNGDFIVSVQIPIDAWLIGYLLSFGTNVEVMEPACLRAMLAEQARAIYEKNKY